MFAHSYIVSGNSNQVNNNYFKQLILIQIICTQLLKYQIFLADTNNFLDILIWPIDGTLIYSGSE